jgi:hypothetical protein
MPKNPAHVTDRRLRIIFAAIRCELRDAERKHPTWPADNTDAAGLVANHVAQLLHAADDKRYNPTLPDYHIIIEAYHTAVTAIRLIAHLFK